MKSYSTERPAAITPVGNGNYLYHYDIAEVPAPSEDDSTPRTQFVCEEVTVQPPLTSNAITKAVITSTFPIDYELKVINDFNAIQLNLCSDEEDAASKAQRYQEYLTERARLKAQVDEDCEKLGIK